MTTATQPTRSAVPGIRPRITGLTAESVFVKRSLLHSLRDGESLLMAIMLPVMLMLLFTFVFGGAIDPSGDYVDYVVPGHHPAVRRVRRGIHRGVRRAGSADRHHRPLPHHAAAQRRRADRPRHLEPRAQSARHRRRDLRRPAGRLPADRRSVGMGRPRSE